MMTGTQRTKICDNPNMELPGEQFRTDAHDGEEPMSAVGGSLFNPSSSSFRSQALMPTGSGQKRRVFAYQIHESITHFNQTCKVLQSLFSHVCPQIHA